MPNIAHGTNMGTFTTLIFASVMSVAFKVGNNTTCAVTILRASSNNTHYAANVLHVSHDNTLCNNTAYLQLQCFMQQQYCMPAVTNTLCSSNTACLVAILHVSSDKYLMQ